MAVERLEISGQDSKFPTAGYGSVAPPWIKADLLKEQQTTVVPTASNSNKVSSPILWLRKQLGWR